MIANNGNLNEFANLARAAKARGEKTIEFEIQALRGFSKFVRLWEDTVGEVIGRVYEQPETPPIPGLPQPRVVTHFRLRVQVTDVLEAQRRRREREAREFGGDGGPDALEAEREVRRRSTLATRR